MVVAKTSDHTQTEDKITSLKFIAKGNPLQGVSGVFQKNVVQKLCKNIVKEIRLSPVAERFLTEREKKGPTLGE